MTKMSASSFPLGKELYVSVSSVKGEPVLKIVRCKVVQSLITPGKSVVLPTRSGVGLTKKQFEQLVRNAPLVFSTMDSLTTTVRSDSASGGSSSTQEVGCSDRKGSKYFNTEDGNVQNAVSQNTANKVQQWKRPPFRVLQQL